LKRSADLRTIVVGALVWAALASASLGVGTGLGGQVPIWLPAGVSVAIFGLTAKRHWPFACVVLGLTGITTFVASGVPWPFAVLLALASLAEGMICAELGVRALGGRVQTPEGARQVVGLFGAGLVGATAFAIIMLPIPLALPLGSGGVEAMAIRLFAHLLGIVTSSWLVLQVRQRIVQAGPSPGPFVTMELAWTLASVAALAIVLFQTSSFVFVPALLAVLILVTVRFAAPAPALNVLAVACIATLTSLGGRSMLPNLEPDPAGALLLVQTWLTLTLITSTPIAAMLATREGMAERLANQNAELEQNVTVFGLAEELAGIGRWQVDMVSGRQTFSAVMIELLGLAPGAVGERGDIRDLLLVGGETIFDELDRHCREPEPYTFNCRVKPMDGPERILRISARNDFGTGGARQAVFAVAKDVTGQVRREEALDLARGRAVRLAAEAQKLANTDVLTELPNRRCSLALLERLVAQAQHDSGSLSVLLFDIDHFKKVNDTFGHKAGDDVLLRVANLARREMRGGDLVGRIGGEEFVCLMPGLGANDARALAERLREAIAAESAGEGLPRVTVSVGIACLRPGDSMGSLLARADEALYGAKEGGRNMVRRVA